MPEYSFPELPETVSQGVKDCGLEKEEPIGYRLKNVNDQTFVEVYTMQGIYTFDLDGVCQAASMMFAYPKGRLTPGP